MTIYGAISGSFRASLEGIHCGDFIQVTPRRGHQLIAIKPTMAKQNFEWTRGNTQQFIELLSEHPCLWQVQSNNYKNKPVKSVSIKTITKQLMSTINCLITSEITMKKLYTLRGQYRREMKEKKAFQKSGADADDLHLPRLWCYDALAFLAAAAAARQALLSSVETKPPNPSLWRVREQLKSSSVDGL